MRLVLLRHLHFIWILFVFLWIQLRRSDWLGHFSEALSSYETATLLLKSERLNKQRFTLLPTTVYLSYLPNRTPSHNLSSNCFPKCKRNNGCFTFVTRDWKKNNEKQFPSVEIVNNVLIYINIKRVFQIDTNFLHC